MKTLYDVQQFLKSFGIVIYMGKRLYDIELMKIELERIYDAGLMDKLEYLEADAVLRREHQLELKYIEKNGEWKYSKPMEKFMKPQPLKCLEYLSIP